MTITFQSFPWALVTVTAVSLVSLGILIGEYFISSSATENK